MKEQSVSCHRESRFFKEKYVFLNLIGQFCRDNLAVTLQLSFRRFPSLKKTYSLN